MSEPCHHCRAEAADPRPGAYSSAFMTSQKQTNAAHPDCTQASPRTPYLSNSSTESTTCMTKPSVQMTICDQGMPNADKNCDTVDVTARKKTPGSRASMMFPVWI